MSKSKPRKAAKPSRATLVEDVWQGMNWIRQEKRLALYHRDGFTCCYCQKGPEAGLKMTLDHLVPRSLGGSNHATNLVMACISCNSSRGNAPVEEFAQTLADQGVDPLSVGPRILERTSRKPDMKEGRRLLAARKVA